MKYISATQITLFRDCPRKWYMSYVLGLKQPPTPNLLFGSKVHKIAEDYLNGVSTPTPTDKATRLVALAIASGVIRPAKPGDLVECSIKGLTCAGVPFRGFIDLYRPVPGRPIVEDHKTTSGWRWAKTAEQLRVNVQMITYAKFALERDPSASEVVLRHNQLLTRGGPDARYVETVVSREHVEREWRAITETVKEIAATHSAEMENVRTEFSACGKFGGCYLRDRCYATPYLAPGETPERTPGPFAGMTSTDKETTMNPKLAALLRAAEEAEKNEETKGPTPTDPAPAPAGAGHGAGVPQVDAAGDSANAPAAHTASEKEGNSDRALPVLREDNKARGDDVASPSLNPPDATPAPELPKLASASPSKPILPPRSVAYKAAEKQTPDPEAAARGRAKMTAEQTKDLADESDLVPVSHTKEATKGSPCFASVDVERLARDFSNPPQLAVHRPTYSDVRVAVRVSDGDFGYAEVAANVTAPEGGNIKLALDDLRKIAKDHLAQSS